MPNLEMRDEEREYEVTAELTVSYIVIWSELPQFSIERVIKEAFSKSGFHSFKVNSESITTPRVRVIKDTIASLEKELQVLEQRKLT